MAVPGSLKFIWGSVTRTRSGLLLKNIVRKMSDSTGKNDKIQFESFGSRLERMKTRTAVKTEYIPPNYVSALVPTLHTDSFDVQGRKIHPWVILKVFDHLDMSWPQYREDLGPDYRSHGIYILKLQLDIQPELYSLDSQLHPLLLEGKLLLLKRTSRVYQNTMRHPDSKNIYATMSGLDVNVDLETRRPVPFPDIWHDPSIPSEGQYLNFDVPIKPSNTIKSQRQVYTSDNDENGHMNYTSYMRFCHDAFVDNLSTGKYQQNAAQHLEAGLKQAQIIFKSESLRGDILDIESWEDVNEDGTYYFEMSKGSELVLSLILRFFINPTNITKGKL